MVGKGVSVGAGVEVAVSVLEGVIVDVEDGVTDGSDVGV